MKGLGTRLITGIIFIVTVTACTFIDPKTFVGLFFVVAVSCLWEFFAIVWKKQEGSIDLVRRILAIITGILPYSVVGICLLSGFHLSEVLIYTLIGISVLCFMLLIFELFAKDEHPFSRVGFSLTGLVYIGIPFTLLALIGLFDGFRPNLILGLLLLTWINDSFAYLMGSLFGKTPLIPRISPKKTREGSLGGVVFTLLGGFLLSLVFPEISAQSWMVMGGIIAVFASLGDLVESMLKRSYSIKDSGGLLPGHGGFLDRFDGFIFMLPFIFMYLYIFEG